MSDRSLERLSAWKSTVLSIAMVVSSLLSIAGSGAIIRISHLKLSSTYQRFLLMLSLSDIFNSFFLILHPFLIPKESNIKWAAGNQTSCSFVGFFFVFGALVVSLYNCFLSLYFYLSIQASPTRQKEPEHHVGKPELVTHLACWLLPIAFGAAATGTKSVNFDPTIELCLVTSEDSALSYIFQATIMVTAFLGFATTVAVKCYVSETLKGGREPGFDANSLSHDTEQRLAAVCSQSILFTTSYLFCFVWPALALTISPKSTDAYFVLQLLAFLLYPLQGLFNCSIYLRPRYQMLRQMYPSDPAIVVFRMAASKAGDPEELENIRASIYGSDYQSSSESSSESSLASDLPLEVEFDPEKPASITSLVSSAEDQSDSSDQEEKDT